MSLHIVEALVTRFRHQCRRRTVHRAVSELELLPFEDYFSVENGHFNLCILNLRGIDVKNIV